MEHFSWQLGRKSVFQHGKRNLISGSAIAIGLVAILTLIGYAQRTDTYLGAIAMYITQPGHIAVIEQDSLRRRFVDPAHNALAPKKIAALEKYAATNPDVAFVSPYLYGVGLIGNGCKSVVFNAFAFDLAKEKAIKNLPELLEVVPEYKPVLAGVPLWESQVSAPIAISKGLAKRLGKSEEALTQPQNKAFAMEDCDPANVQSPLAKDPSVQMMAQDYQNQLNAVEATFVGDFDTGSTFTDGSALRMPLSQLQELLRTDKISFLGIFLKDRKKAFAVSQDLMDKLAQQGIFVDAFTWDDARWNPNFFATRNILRISELFVSVIIAAVVFISILNTLNIGLVESRREIGTLRALGYKPKQVALIYAIESLCVAAIALAVGSALSVLLFRCIDWLQVPMIMPGASQPTVLRITPPTWTYGAASLLLFVMVVGVNLVISRRYASQPTLTLLDRGN